MSAEFGERGGVISGVFGAAVDGLVNRGTGQGCCAKVSVLGHRAKKRRTSGGTRYSPMTHMSVERFSLPE